MEQMLSKDKDKDKEEWLYKTDDNFICYNMQYTSVVVGNIYKQCTHLCIGNGTFLVFELLQTRYHN